MKTHSHLDKVFQPGGLSVVFQPIFETSKEGNRLHSIECLARGPKGTNLERADILFEYARRKQSEDLLDKEAISIALQCASGFSPKPNLSINVHASSLDGEGEFLTFLKNKADAYSISFSRLTIEIVEHAPIWHRPSFLHALEELRKLGAKIALDDIGLGQSNYRMILDCRPDYFKIDRYFINGSNADSYRQAMVESISQLALKLGAGAVAEGVEEIADLNLVTSLGINLIQGFIFSRPLTSSELIGSGFLERAFSIG